MFVDGSGDVVEHVAPGVGENRLFHRSRKPLRNGRGEVTAHLFVYRDVSTALEIERMRMEVTRLRSEVETNYSFARIIGSGPAMQRMYDLMRRALGGDVTVLITGESGTGKELVAKALHFGGARKEHPFVAINCAAIPPALIESELFGHEQGAFTGATTRRLGCFERAHGGTVLLDEIGDMHPELQAKLLRVLQEGEVQRIGGDAPLPVDVRVIASTNQDLSARLDAGEFRADLYFRLNTFPIAVPPLRKRREDIPLLAGHFLKEICERHGKAVSGISAGASRLMMRYEWPGNGAGAAERNRTRGAAGGDRDVAARQSAAPDRARGSGGGRRRRRGGGAAGRDGAAGDPPRPGGNRSQRVAGGAGPWASTAPPCTASSTSSTGTTSRKTGASITRCVRPYGSRPHARSGRRPAAPRRRPACVAGS